MLFVVDGQIPRTVLHGGRRSGDGGVSQGSADTGKKLRAAKGLCDVIVRSEVKCLYLILFLAAGGNDNNRNRRPDTQLGNDIHTVHIGQT